MTQRGASKIEAHELEAFVEHYVALGFNFKAAAKAIGRDVRTLYRHRETDEAFRTALVEARAAMLDAVRAEIYRRAVEGVERRVYYQGVELETVREYSDTLLVLMAKSLPEYREAIDVNVAGTVDLSDTQIAARLSAIIAAARQRRGEVLEGEVVETKALPAQGDKLWD